MPYNYMCVQTGVLVSQLTSISDLMTWSTLAQMSLVAVVALLPGMIVKRKQAQAWFAAQKTFCIIGNHEYFYYSDY